MKLGFVAATAALLLILNAGVAAADPITASPEQNDPTLRPVVHERRGGVVIGVAAGVGFAGASGSPNNARFFNNPDYYLESPLLAGWSGTAFVMGALTDWISIGPSVTLATFETSQWKSTGFGVGFRGEVFPFVKIVPSLGDLSVYGQLGVGSAQLRAKGPYPNSDGSSSFFSIGVHHEWRFVNLLGAHASAGPFIEYDAISSEASERHWLALGLRVAFYSSGNRVDR